MSTQFRFSFLLIGLLMALPGGISSASAQQTRPAEPLAGTDALTASGDLAMDMVAGIDRHLTKLTTASIEARDRLWAAGPRTDDQRRRRLAAILGLVKNRKPPGAPETVGTLSMPSRVANTSRYTVDAIRWPVFDGLEAEGLLLQPAGKPVAYVVALPDADGSPEMIVGLSAELPPTAHFARRLAENGCLVVIPTLIDRKETWSGNPKMSMTNQPHREFIYRMAFELGRHVIGYEVHKVLAAVDWFEELTRDQPRRAIGVAGYGEGGLLALYSAAVDPRITAAWVSGHFQPRQDLWQEPIYRSVWGLLTEFGDAELAAMIAPRGLVIEASRGPEVAGPPWARDGRRGAAPGRLVSPPLEAVRAECERARQLCARAETADRLRLIEPADADPGPGSEQALAAFLRALGRAGMPEPAGTPPEDARPLFDPRARLQRQFLQMVDYTQGLLPQSEAWRRESFWLKVDASSLDRWNDTVRPRRGQFWKEVMGRVEGLPKWAVRTRKSYDQPKWTGYETVIEMGPDVFAYGILCVPRDLRPGEKRPVVVCQHGLDGRPSEVVDPSIQSVYHAFGARLAELGYIVYAPQNPYIGGDTFRLLQRKAHPLALSLFSFIIAQHEATLEWLAGLPFVDSDRIAFYGLSYGGKTAMRVPAVLPRYCLSICSGDFNEWVRKNAAIDYPNGYMFTGEFEMPEWNLGPTFNYAEMAGLIAPRPFMVERGHDDGVGTDEWVAYEYAKVRRLYAQLGIPERTGIEFFNSGHEIHGVGTFAFLKRHLGWPK